MEKFESVVLGLLCKIFKREREIELELGIPNLFNWDFGEVELLLRFPVK